MKCEPTEFRHLDADVPREETCPVCGCVPIMVIEDMGEGTYGYYNDDVVAIHEDDGAREGEQRLYVHAKVR